MSRGKWEEMKSFDPTRYEKLRNDRGYSTDRKFCEAVSTYGSATCSTSHLSRAKKSRSISPSILNAMAAILKVPPEYLSGEMSEDMLDMVRKMPSGEFREMQKYFNLSPDMKEAFFKYELFDLGIYDQWMKLEDQWKDLDEQQRSECHADEILKWQRQNYHAAICEFSKWLLDYIQPDKYSYKEMFDFFSQTGVLIESNPDLRQELFKTLTVTYKTFIEMHK